MTNRLRILSLNALIEANHAGEAGRGFSVVADEVRAISHEVEDLSGELASDLGGKIDELLELTQLMASSAQGARLVDLALNAIEIIDRNLYERTCDVRWWATDSAIVEAATSQDEARCSHAGERLGVILDAYTVYLDLWLCSLDGRVIANGRPQSYAIEGASVADSAWFQRAKTVADGNGFIADDIRTEPLLHDGQVATYATVVREGGETNGRPVGVLAVHFDWQPQAAAIVTGVRLTEEERRSARVMLVDAKGRIIASSTGEATLGDKILLRTERRNAGYYREPDGRVVAFHLTPGYETYQGLGWHGVIELYDVSMERGPALHA